MMIRWNILAVMMLLGLGGATTLPSADQGSFSWERRRIEQLKAQVSMLTEQNALLQKHASEVVAENLRLKEELRQGAMPMLPSGTVKRGTGNVWHYVMPVKAEMEVSSHLVTQR
ncbi:MAG TPA: bZIP transcription factor [Tepidisphaeraceae bacterium]|jgi:hypothetical protein|nr:bZIP transcription factor [Tepidisphaeraceae bacterium]